MSTKTRNSQPPPCPRKADPARRRPLGRRGTVAIMAAMAVPTLLAFTGLVVEVGNWYLIRRKAQTAADMAAMTGAAVLNLRTTATAKTEARTVASGTAAFNGFDDAKPDVTVTVNSPPAAGTKRNVEGFIEVVITRNVSSSLMRAANRLTTGADPQSAYYSRTISARGVAELRPGSPFCLYAKTRVIIDESNSMEVRNCGLHANGNAANAITLGKMNSLSAHSVTTGGGCEDGNTRHCDNLGNKLRTGVASIDNPFSDLDDTSAPNSAPLYTGKASEIWNGPNASDRRTTPYNRNDRSTWDSNSFRPGKYVGAGSWTSSTSPNTLTTFRLSANSLTLTPGTYYFHNANLLLESNNSVTCDGCTFVFTGDSAGQVGTLSVLNSNSTILRAPTTDSNADIPGMLFVRASGTSGNQQTPGVDIYKNNSTEMSGGQYFGNSFTNWNDSNSASSQLCNPMVSGILNITGSNSAVFSTEGCASRRMRAPRTPPLTVLVE